MIGIFLMKPMTRMLRLASMAGGILLLSQGAAHAHLGHLGELAGHSHWAGIALTGAAIALAGWVIKDRATAEETEAESEDNNQGLQGDGSHSETGDEVHA